jgi:hypothetical protein
VSQNRQRGPTIQQTGENQGRIMLIDEKITKFRSLTPDIKSNSISGQNFPNFVYPESKFQKGTKVLAEVSPLDPVRASIGPSQPINHNNSSALGMPSRISAETNEPINAKITAPSNIGSFSFRGKESTDIQKQFQRIDQLNIQNPNNTDQNPRGLSFDGPNNNPAILRTYSYIDPNHPNSSVMLKTPYPVRIINQNASNEASLNSERPVSLTNGPSRYQITPKQSISSVNVTNGRPSMNQSEKRSITSNKSGTVFFINHDFDDQSSDPRRTISHSPSIIRRSVNAITPTENRVNLKQSGITQQEMGQYKQTISTNVQQSPAYQIRPIDFNHSIADLKLFLESSKVFTESQRNILVKFQEKNGQINNSTFDAFQSVINDLDIYLKSGGNSKDYSGNSSSMQERLTKMKFEFGILKGHIEYAYKVGSLQSNLIKQLNQELSIHRHNHDKENANKHFDFEKEYLLMKIKMRSIESTKEKHLNDCIRLNQEYQSLFEKHSQNKLLNESLQAKVRELTNQNLELRKNQGIGRTTDFSQDQNVLKFSGSYENEYSQTKENTSAQIPIEPVLGKFKKLLEGANPSNDTLDINQILPLIDYKTKVCLKVYKNFRGIQQFATGCR